MKTMLAITAAVSGIVLVLFGITLINGDRDQTGTYVLVFGFIFLVIGAIFANRNRPPS